MDIIWSRTRAIELTPHLQKLNLYILGVTDLTLCAILSNRSLADLHLDFSDCEQRPDTEILYHIFSRAPQLRKLHITAKHSFLDGDLPEILRQALLNADLEKFCLTVDEDSRQPPPATRKFGLALPITHLVLWCFSDAFLPIKIGIREGLFESLSSLDIKASFTNMSSCFSGTPRLSRLKITSRWPEDASTVDHLLACASRCLPSMKNLGIWAQAVIRTDEDSMTYRMLGKHSVVRSLTHFSLKGPSALGGTNDDLASLILCMPNIVDLFLTYSLVGDVRSDLTLDILSTFAFLCPKLRHLGLLIDCRIPPSLETLENDCTSYSVLERLSLAKSPINPMEPHILASWLKRILPKSCSVSFSYLLYGREKVKEELERLRSESD